MANWIHKVHCAMEKVPWLRGGVIPWIENLKIMDKRRAYLGYKNVVKRWKATRFKDFVEFYDAHVQEFNALEAMLEDEFSRKTLRTVVRFYKTFFSGGEIQQTYSKKILQKVVVHPQYFQQDILKPVEDEVFVDGGAYVGDTIQGLIQFGGGHYWKKVYAWEPDEVNRRALVEQYGNCANVEIVPFGLWSERTELHFNMSGSDGSMVCDSGEQVVQVDSIDHVCAGEKVTFIKMDIEGSEQEALRGAETVIRRDKPRLCVCIYHKPEDFIEIPRMVKQMVPEYKLYIRHHTEWWGDTVLYATTSPQ